MCLCRRKITYMNTTQKSSEFWAKLITLLVFAILLLFFASHLAFAVNICGLSSDTVRMFSMHLSNRPFDIFHFHPIVFLYAFGVWLVGAVGIISRRILPKAEMKGKEKGSNSFMTRKEIDEFLKNNTSEVLR